MENQSKGWQTKQAYAMGVLCLIVGGLMGYLFRGSASPGSRVASSADSTPVDTGSQIDPLEQMKRMADKKAQPVLARLKTDPNNTALLIEVGSIYQSSHQFKEAAGYYEKFLASDPKNVAVRTEMGSCLYYSGDIDGALTQLQRALQDDPNDANALFNVGIVKWKGKNDAKGAQEAWQRLLKTNPGLDAQKRATVNKMIADAKRRGTSN